MPRKTLSSPPRFTAPPFCKMLDGAGEQAILTAQSYLLRGVGEYRPSPPIRGVDRITVSCVRTFGQVVRTIRDEKLDFLLIWENAAKRRELLRVLGFNEKNPPEKEVAASAFMARSSQPVQNQKSSGEYQVQFKGTAGVWAARFVVGCASFDQGAVTEFVEQDPADDFEF